MARTAPGSLERKRILAETQEKITGKRTAELPGGEPERERPSQRKSPIVLASARVPQEPPAAVGLARPAISSQEAAQVVQRVRPQAKTLKPQIAKAAGVSLSQVNDKNLIGAQAISLAADQSGESISTIDPRAAKAAIGEPTEKDSQEDLDNQQKIALVIAALAPILVGSLLGGLEGGALGGEIGARTATAIGEGFQKEADQKKQDELDQSLGVAKAAADEAKGIADSDERRAKVTSALRKERNALPTTKDTQAVAAAFEKIKNFDASAGGDLGLIFNFMKMLDPGSVVRESEFATAQNAAGVPDRIRNLWNRLLRGERLNPVQRKDFKRQAMLAFEAQMKLQGRIDNQYSRIATDAGVDAQDVIIEFQADDSESKTPETPPATARSGGGLPGVTEAFAGEVSPEEKESMIQAEMERLRKLGQ